MRPSESLERIHVIWDTVPVTLAVHAFELLGLRTATQRRPTIRSHMPSDHACGSALPAAKSLGLRLDAAAALGVLVFLDSNHQWGISPWRPAQCLSPSLGTKPYPYPHATPSSSPGPSPGPSPSSSPGPTPTREQCRTELVG